MNFERQLIGVALEYRFFGLDSNFLGQCLVGSLTVLLNVTEAPKVTSGWMKSAFLVLA